MPEPSGRTATTGQAGSASTTDEYAPSWPKGATWWGLPLPYREATAAGTEYISDGFWTTERALRLKCWLSDAIFDLRRISTPERCFMAAESIYLARAHREMREVIGVAARLMDIEIPQTAVQAIADEARRLSRMADDARRRLPDRLRDSAGQEFVSACLRSPRAMWYLSQAGLFQRHPMPREIRPETSAAAVAAIRARRA